MARPRKVSISERGVPQKKTERDTALFLKKLQSYSYLIPLISILAFISCILATFQYVIITNLMMYGIFFGLTLFIEGILSQMFPTFFKQFSVFTFDYVYK